MMFLFLIAEQYSIISMNHIFFILSLIERHLGSFQFMAITNKAAINIVEEVFLWYDGVSFEYMARSDIAGSSGKTIHD